jgi:Zn-dependent peptidase ImmA (M78 family)
MISEFKLKRRIKKLLAELDLSPSFNAASLCRRLRKKGYKISLCPTQMPPGLESAYILCEKTHVICVKESASLFRQQYLIFHELGHILLGHRTLQTDELLWGGTIYSRWEEREAEMFASLLMEAAFASQERAGLFSEHFQQALSLVPKKEPEEEMESLTKIAAFFQRFDARTKPALLQEGL